MSYATWNREEYEPEPLVDRLEKLRRPAGEGEAPSFEGSVIFDDVVTVLEQAIKLSIDMTEHDHRALFSSALSDAAKKGPLTAGPLIGEVNRRVRKFAEAPNREFILATSLSVRYFPELADTEISGCPIAFGRVLPEHLRGGHNTIKERARRHVFGEYPDKSMSHRYTAVWVSVRGRSQFEAFSKALAALDLLRGIWNFILNYLRVSRSLAGKRKPVNEVLLGPVHSLHNPDGGLVSETAGWYEYDYVGEAQTDRLRGYWEHVKGEEAHVRSDLARSGYRLELEEAIRKYTRALDSREWDAAFIQLWGLLEYLTDTGPRDSHEVTIKRTTFLYTASERDLHRQVLKHLRNYRNRSVHRGESSEDIETYLYQLKRHVEEALRFNLGNPHGFSNRAETARFLDQPPDRGAIERKISDLKQAIEKKQAEIELAEKARRFHSEA